LSVLQPVMSTVVVAHSSAVAARLEVWCLTHGFPSPVEPAD
jgi:hypothetical protein